MGGVSEHFMKSNEGVKDKGLKGQELVSFQGINEFIDLSLEFATHVTGIKWLSNSLSHHSKC